jgi:hypothetical protein
VKENLKPYAYKQSELLGSENWELEVRVEEIGGADSTFRTHIEPLTSHFPRMMAYFL